MKKQIKIDKYLSEKDLYMNEKGKIVTQMIKPLKIFKSSFN